jgi:hypothetical protein
MPKSPLSFFRNARDETPWYYRDARKRRPRAVRVASVVAGTVLTAAVAFAATNWTVSLNSGSSGEAQAGTVSNLTIAAVAIPAASNLLFPGGNGDVVATITNPNSVAVTLTALSLPSSTTYATGYTASNLTGAISGCTSTAGANQSDVIWNYSSGSNPHTLTTALVIGANSSLTVTFTNDASMTAAAPAACEAAYFSMPSLTGVTASETAGSTATTSPTTDAWTS